MATGVAAPSSVRRGCAPVDALIDLTLRALGAALRQLQPLRGQSQPRRRSRWACRYSVMEQADAQRYESSTRPQSLQG